MSDINQPCPTICSACKGKCSDQLVLPAGCVLRPTIERVEAVLTPERIADLFPKGSCSPGLAIVAFARAISREVVAILAQQPLSDEAIDRIYDRDEFDEMDGTGAVLRAYARAIERAHGISTPAASGIGESGGE